MSPTPNPALERTIRQRAWFTAVDADRCVASVVARRSTRALGAMNPYTAPRAEAPKFVVEPVRPVGYLPLVLATLTWLSAHFVPLTFYWFLQPLVVSPTSLPIFVFFNPISWILCFSAIYLLVFRPRNSGRAALPMLTLFICVPFVCLAAVASMFFLAGLLQ